MLLPPPAATEQASVRFDRAFGAAQSSVYGSLRSCQQHATPPSPHQPSGDRTLKNFIFGALILLLASQMFAQTTLMGTSSVLSVDSNPNALAQAYRETANASGTATVIEFYVDPTSTSTLAAVALYSGSTSAPKSLLAQASFVPVSGWNAVSIPAVSITKGTTYWIAELGLGSGTLVYRDGSGSCPAPDMTGLTAGFAATWKTADNWKQCGISAYVLTGAAAPAPIAVSLSPTSASVVEGATQQFTATVANSTNTAANWSATCGSVVSGLFTAPATPQTCTVTATSQASASASASATVTVTAPGVVTVSLSPASSSILTNATKQFAATVTGTTNTAVTWTASGGTISTAGLYTAPATAGTYTVTATSAANTAVSASATVTVTAPVVTVTISPTTASLAIDTTQQFKATVTGTSTTTVTWSATGGTVSSSGKYTAPNTTGSYTVTATSTANTAVSASATVTVTASGPTNLTVDGSLTYQTIDGLGANMNPDMWLGGNLKPALDLWTQTNGASLYRLTIESTDWVCPGCTLAEANAQISLLHNLDSATLASTYGTSKMEDLWNMIAYMNADGIPGSGIMLNTQGWTATWMGGTGAYGSGSTLTPGLEPQFATMWASLAYYGLNVKGVSFSLIDPVNETDGNGTQGPEIGPSQLATAYADLVNELAYMGLTNITLVGPSNGSPPNISYSDALEDNITVQSNIKHFDVHSYPGGGSESTGPAIAIPATYPGADWWVSETNINYQNGDYGTCPGPSDWTWSKETGDLILGELLNGFSAVMVWGGYDSYELMESPPPVPLNCFWYMSYNTGTGVFAPLNGFYVTASINHFIRPGSVRISATDTVSGGNTVATYNSAAGQVSIVGHNVGSSSITINGQLKNLPVTMTSLALYFTNSSTNFQSQSAVPVSTSGAFTVAVPADTFFSLSN
ncbi:MAG: Ig-like domain-containing protein [Terriglobales bacterium]